MVSNSDLKYLTSIGGLTKNQYWWLVNNAKEDEIGKVINELKLTKNEFDSIPSKMDKFCQLSKRQASELIEKLRGR